ncbi:MAG: ABC transporter substrate-binding protein [Desulfobacterales bacterium]|nr:ABC transporter substrate-binding protein [Desulfobacterales bacterium]
MRKLKKLLILLAAVLFISSCDAEKKIAERTEKASGLNSEVTVGVVASLKTPNLFVEGVSLAIKEINQEGGVLGKKIIPLVYDDNRSLEEGQEIASELAENTDVTAVVGHRYSAIAIPASVTYEKNHILFISPGATNPSFTQYGGDFTFRNIPSDEEIGRHMADFCKMQGYKKIVIIYERETGGKMLSEIFHEEATDLKIKIVATRSYSRWENDFRHMISQILRGYEFDAVFLGGLLPFAAKVIKQARDMGIDVPFIGSSNLDSSELFSVAGDAAEGVVIPTVFNAKKPTRITREFVKRFEAEFGVVPDVWAAQGYDAIRLLAYAIEESGSTVPIVLGSTLRILENWQGVAGDYSFTFKGDITGRNVFFKEFRNGKFVYLEHEHDEEEQKPDPYYVIEETTLRLPVEGVITTVDPGLTQDTTSIEITEQLFMGLTDLDPETYEAIPEMATHWTVSQDGKTYVFNIRGDITWTDGETVTAHDIVWAIRRNIRPETNCPYAYMLYILKNAQAINNGEKDPSEIGVQAIDNFIVVFELEYPASYFPAMAGLWVYRPLPRHIVEEHGDLWTEPVNIQTNASYMLVAWKKGMVMVLRKNPDYYEAEKVSIPEVRYYVIPESSLGLVMYENNELDIMGSSYLRLPLMEIQRIKQDPVLSKEYRQEPQFCTYAYGFNTKLPPVDDPLVRKAISAAIDRELMIKLVTQGGEETASTFSRPPVFGSVAHESGVGISFNPVQAKKWLDEAGYADRSTFPAISLMYNVSETHAKIAKAVQISLKHYLNIDITIKEKSWENYVDSLNQPNTPHMFRFGWCVDYPDANNFLNDNFHPFKSANYIGWENGEFAELMDRAVKSPHQDERKRLYRRAEEILCQEEVAVVPIYFETAHCLVNPRVDGWYHMALGGQHIRDWSFKE